MKVTICSLGLVIATAGLAVGCVTIPASQVSQKTRSELPENLKVYYQTENSYRDVQEISRTEYENYRIQRFRLASDVGPIWLDYFDCPSSSDSLVLVFPVLGGNNLIESYFADYIAKNGFDTAIVHRSDEFRDPENFDSIEETFRNNVIRDRIALDFFEKHLRKKHFGSFGISRGAINVAMTAGVDNRLAHNVLVLGGTELVNLFRRSDQPGIRKYIKTIADDRNLSEDEIFSILEKKIVTDPKNLSHYIDPRNTLLVLAAFDSTVPFKSGMKLRRDIGNPETIVLFADHYVALLFTQLVKILPPISGATIFPLDYVESEAVRFYRKQFNEPKFSWHSLPYRILKAPLDGIVWVWHFLL